MSFAAIRGAWEIDVPTAKDRLVLLALANYADKTLECFPSMRTLISITSLSKSSIAHLLPKATVSPASSQDQASHLTIAFIRSRFLAVSDLLK